jgi:aspartyl-tRNA(Asn)/glutamyl-tRNA(Gln) amidotransferase subunit C
MLILRLMSAPEFDVRYTAQLARLHLDEEEIAKFQAQLSHVLDYVEKLRTVDVAGVEPTAHTNPVFNVFRADEPREWFTAEEALKNAPRKANNLFVVTKVVE